MAAVVSLEDLIARPLPAAVLAAEPPDGDSTLVPLTDHPAVLAKFWGCLMAMAVRDHAASVHYHPWRADGGLAYVVHTVWYAMASPPPELAGPMIAAARDLFVHPGRRGWLRWRGKVDCGSVELDVAGRRIVWDAVVWSAGGRTGLELYRISPPAPAVFIPPARSTN